VMRVTASLNSKHATREEEEEEEEEEEGGGGRDSDIVLGIM
jgi:hypothetical protein